MLVLRRFIAPQATGLLLNLRISRLDFTSISPSLQNFNSPSHVFCSKTSICFQAPNHANSANRVTEVYEIIKRNLNPHDDMELALDQIGVCLNTSLVTEILEQLKFEEKSAFRFFMWAGNQAGYSHERCAYSKMIDILSSTKYKSGQYCLVCDLLDHMKRSGKTVVPNDDLLEILRNYCESHLTITRKFGKVKKRIQTRTSPKIVALNMLLDFFCKCGLVLHAESLCSRVKKVILPNADTYTVLFFGWCKARNAKRSLKLLEEMVMAGYKPDAFAYNAALDAYSRAGLMDEAKEIFNFMRSEGCTTSSPTTKTYAIMFIALARRNQMEECFMLLGEMINNGCLPDVSTYKEMIEGMCSAGKVDEVYRFLEEMARKGYRPDVVTYNCFMKVLCDRKNSEEAMRLYGKMISIGCVPSVQTYNLLISMFFSMDDPDGAFDSWNEMEKRGCMPDTETYFVMINGLFNCHNLKDAYALLDEVVSRGLKLPYQMFDSLLQQLSAIGDLHGIQVLSSHMNSFYNHGMAKRLALRDKRKRISLRKR